MKITLIKGDITDIKADAIVNAANSSLLGGGGVDGAIHRKAGLKLSEECKKIRKEQYPDGLPTGEAVATKGYNLKARYIIHTVGPVYRRDDISLLKSCYLNSLKIAENLGCNTIAFPAISTGAYGVPVEESAKIVKGSLKDYSSKTIKELLLVLYSQKDYDTYKKEID